MVLRLVNAILSLFMFVFAAETTGSTMMIVLKF